MTGLEFALLLAVLIIIICFMNQEQISNSYEIENYEPTVNEPTVINYSEDLNDDNVPPGYVLSSTGRLIKQPIDLRNESLVLVNGKTGYYSNGVFTPLYETTNKNTFDSQKSISTDTMKHFGSVQSSQDTEVKKPSMSTSRALSAQVAESVNMVIPGDFIGGSNDGGGVGSDNTRNEIDPVRAMYGSVSDPRISITSGGLNIPQDTGFARLTFGDSFHRGSKNTLGSALYESRSTYPVFDIAPVPTISPQLKAIAQATSLAPTPVINITQ
jgi:hypothetical protein